MIIIFGFVVGMMGIDVVIGDFLFGLGDFY